MDGFVDPEEIIVSRLNGFRDFLSNFGGKDQTLRRV